MATATAAPQVSKTQQAAKLRAEIQGLEVALSKSTASLARAQEELSRLVDERKALEQAAARGLQQKPGVVAKLLMEIGEAEIPVAGLGPIVSEQRAQLTQAQERLWILDHELAAEAQQAARAARFAELEKKGNAAADVIAGKLRTLLEVDFVALDQTMDLLVAEFVGGKYSTGSGPEAQAARKLLGELTAKLSAGDQQTVAERDLLRGNDQKRPWTVRNDYSFFLRNLAPPKKA